MWSFGWYFCWSFRWCLDWSFGRGFRGFGFCLCRFLVSLGSFLCRLRISLCFFSSGFLFNLCILYGFYGLYGFKFKSYFVRTRDMAHTALLLALDDFFIDKKIPQCVANLGALTDPILHAVGFDDELTRLCSRIIVTKNFSCVGPWVAVLWHDHDSVDRRAGFTNAGETDGEHKEWRVRRVRRNRRMRR